MANGWCNEPFLCTLVPTYMVLSTESYQKWSPMPVIAPQKIHMGEKTKVKIKEGGRKERGEKVNGHIHMCGCVLAWERVWKK